MLLYLPHQQFLYRLNLKPQIPRQHNLEYRCLYLQMPQQYLYQLNLHHQVLYRLLQHLYRQLLLQYLCLHLKLRQYQYPQASLKYQTLRQHNPEHLCPNLQVFHQHLYQLNLYYQVLHL